jgi:hypothetical protein
VPAIRAALLPRAARSKIDPSVFQPFEADAPRRRDRRGGQRKPHMVVNCDRAGAWPIAKTRRQSASALSGDGCMS